MEIGRNEPCPCGSGKKYKKCCGKTGSISVQDLIHTELDTVQMQLIESVYTKINEDMAESYQTYFANHKWFAKDEEIYEMAFTIWSLFLYKNTENQTLANAFIDKYVDNILRPQSQESVAAWKQAPFVAGTVTSISDGFVTVENSLTGEFVTVKESDSDITKNSFLIGVVLSYGETQSLFGQYFIFPGLGEELTAYAKKNVKDKVENHFFEFVAHSFEAYEVSKTVGAKPKIKGKSKFNKVSYETALSSLQTYLEANSEEAEQVEFVSDLLQQYLERAQPSMRNPNVYAAAMVEAVKHYLPKHVNLLQKEIASSFDVSPQSISKKSKEMVEVMDDVLSQKEGLAIQPS
ncbi:SEC-C metal-binding domain-containing protein [Bacillus sp. 2205SS5-2]|uniref:SEC-C metal-binding domain-containing protein n=1 Tax=Bacillus sp. 2205SS5-2 TaxID=3109031 RepID=UPI0030070F8A